MRLALPTAGYHQHRPHQVAQQLQPPCRHQQATQAVCCLRPSHQQMQPPCHQMLLWWGLQRRLRTPACLCPRQPLRHRQTPLQQLQHRSRTPCKQQRQQEPRQVRAVAWSHSWCRTRLRSQPTCGRWLMRGMRPWACAPRQHPAPPLALRRLRPRPPCSSRHSTPAPACTVLQAGAAGLCSCWRKQIVCRQLCAAAPQQPASSSRTCLRSPLARSRDRHPRARG